MTRAIFGMSSCRPASAWMMLAIVMISPGVTCAALAPPSMSAFSAAWSNRSTICDSISVGVDFGWNS